MVKKHKKYFLIFVLPTLIAFAIGFIYPFFQGIYLSFCKFHTVSNAKLIGFDNYVKHSKMKPLCIHSGLQFYLLLFQ